MENATKIYRNKDGKWDVYHDEYDIIIHCESLEEQEKAKEMLKKLNEMRWIPVSERLPEESGNYMTCIYNEERDGYKLRQIWFAHENDYDIDESGWSELYYFERVVAWMPLPEPYREKNI